MGDFIGRRSGEDDLGSKEVAGGRGGGHVGGYPAVIGSKLYCGESRPVTSHDVDVQTTIQRGSGARQKSARKSGTTTQVYLKNPESTRDSTTVRGHLWLGVAV